MSTELEKVEKQPLFQDNRSRPKRGILSRVRGLICDMFGARWQEIAVLPVKQYDKQKLPFGYLYVSRNTFTGELKGEVITQNKVRQVDLRYYEGQLKARGEHVPWRKFLN